MLLASTSSAYGANVDMLYPEIHKADHQMPFYAATKKANDPSLHSYKHLYDVFITMFRLFGVYGPWERPDMAPMKFAKLILKSKPIDVYNHGRMRRDCIFVDVLVNALHLLLNIPPTGQPILEEFDSSSSVAPFRLVNIGKSTPDELTKCKSTLKTAFSKKASQTFMETQPVDVPATWADTLLLYALTGYYPRIYIETVGRALAKWYFDYYGKHIGLAE